METEFTRSQFKEVVIVRPSLVVGTDDYTKRLFWHFDRIKNEQPIYFPSLKIRSNFIRSDYAGLAMKQIGLSSHTGAINLTSPDSIILGELMGICETHARKKMILTERENQENHSPYGGSLTKTMNTDLLNTLKIKIPPSETWIGKLVSELGQI